MLSVDIDKGHPVAETRVGVRDLLAASARIVRRGPMWVVAGGLLAVDLAFTLIQVAVEATDYGFNGAYRLSLQTEFGVAAAFGLIQLGTAAILLGMGWRRFRSPHALLWASVLAYVAVDDAWTVHENLGAYFVRTLDLGTISGLRAQDVGELLAYALVGIISLGALVIVERRTGPPTPSVLSRLMLPLVGLLVVFAVVIDIVGGAIMSDTIGIAIEDGGELFAMTFILLGAWIWVDRADELAAEL